MNDFQKFLFAKKSKNWTAFILIFKQLCYESDKIKYIVKLLVLHRILFFNDYLFYKLTYIYAIFSKNSNNFLNIITDFEFQLQLILVFV